MHLLMVHITECQSKDIAYMKGLRKALAERFPTHKIVFPATGSKTIFIDYLPEMDYGVAIEAAAIRDRYDQEYNQEGE